MAAQKHSDCVSRLDSSHTLDLFSTRTYSACEIDLQKCRVNIRAVRRPLVRSPSTCVLPSLSNTSILSACASSSGESSLCASDAEEVDAVMSNNRSRTRPIRDNGDGMETGPSVGGVVEVGKCPCRVK
jgi:hypothetical protein